MHDDFMTDTSSKRPKTSDEAKTEPETTEVFQALLEKSETPSTSALVEAVAQNPEMRSDLVEFATEWALLETLPEAPNEGLEAPSAVGMAMERLQSHLASRQQERKTPTDPFAGRPPTELHRVAGRLGLDKTLLAKLRDRKIVAETVPADLRSDLGRELQVPMAVVAAHLAAPPVIPMGMEFKSRTKPQVGEKETFGEAVRRSHLSEVEKARWLTDGEVDREG